MDSFLDTGWKDCGLPCLMTEAPEREREGSGERNRSGSECVCGYRLFTVRLSALVGTPVASGSLRQKRQARELFLVCFGCYSLGEYETATARRGSCRTDVPGRRGAQTDRYPSGGGPGSDRRSG